MTELRRSSEVLGAISLPRPDRRTRLLRRIRRDRSHVLRVLANRVCVRAIERARRVAFAADLPALDGVSIVDVANQRAAADLAARWRCDALFQISAGIIRQPLPSRP